MAEANDESEKVLSKGVPPPGIGGVGFGSSPNLAMDHIIDELCLHSESDDAETLAFRMLKEARRLQRLKC